MSHPRGSKVRERVESTVGVSGRCGGTLTLTLNGSALEFYKIPMVLMKSPSSIDMVAIWTRNSEGTAVFLKGGPVHSFSPPKGMSICSSVRSVRTAPVSFALDRRLSYQKVIYDCFHCVRKQVFIIVCHLVKRTMTRYGAAATRNVTRVIR